MQAMALDLDSRIEKVRKAIKSVPGRPDLLTDFTDQQLQKLADEDMTRVELFRMVSREELRGLGIPLALAAELQAGGLQGRRLHLDGATMPTCLSPCTASSWEGAVHISTCDSCT